LAGHAVNRSILGGASASLRYVGSGQVLSVSVGRVAAAAWADGLKRTAIDKRPVPGPVQVRRLGLDGDEQADTANHGGTEQAVYVYAREDLDWWAELLGRDLRDGFFGENITTEGLDVTGALIGERWRLGTAVVQVTSCRIPCVVFRNWTGETGWVKRFAQAERPGAYLRVLEEGAVAPGDEVTVLDQPAVRVTVGESMRAYYGDAELTRRLLSVPGRSTKWDGELGSGPAGLAAEPDAGRVSPAT
jgi:MOSC domain-containing protein YiiM